MERSQLKQIVEALIVAAGEPVSAARLAEIVPGLEAGDVPGLVAALRGEYETQGRALEIWEVAGGYQLRTHASVAPYLRLLHRERAVRLTRAALETLAVIAYRQPATRAEVEHVRGVDAGPVLKSLVDRKLVRIAGHREVPGRPLVYATTKRFLELFGLPKLDDLPTLREVEELLPPPESAAAITPLDAETAEAIADAPPPGELH
ncbi:MAG: SMC-Scp complex subunit ScpB [Myxococcota bacterium]